MILLLALTLATLLVLALTGRLSFLRREFSDRRRRTVALLLLALVLALGIFPATVTEPVGQEELDGMWFPGLFLGHLLFSLFLAAWWSLRPRAPAPIPTRVHGNDLRYGLQLGLAGWGITVGSAMLIGGLLQSLLPVDPAVPVTEHGVPLVMKYMAELSVGRKIAVVLIAMTVEEAFFRGFLQRRIGYLPSSILFAIGHAGYGIPSMLIGVFVISLVLGWGLIRTGRVLPCMIAHGVFDAIQIFVVIPLAVRTIEGG